MGKAQPKNTYANRKDTFDAVTRSLPVVHNA
jgi:hypothetical protein